VDFSLPVTKVLGNEKSVIQRLAWHGNTAESLSAGHMNAQRLADCERSDA